MKKSELAKERKEKIIEATIQCISEFGLYNFSMHNVAKIAAVSKGIIHYYFLDKEDLINEVLNKVNNELEYSITNDLLETDPIKKILKIIAVCFEIIKEKKEYFNIHIDFWGQANHKPYIKQKIASKHAKLRHEIAGIIEYGIEKNIFENVDPHLTASMILAFIDGIALQWIIDENAFQYDDIIKYCKEIMVIFLKCKD
ncbi:MAG: TetR/AcrR family transcriptional regulator [Silvanigrellaceae bacterium]|nr:TetR/AcrR family transcriptional regulator [Silvanigrellaceae bacterium]